MKSYNHIFLIGILSTILIAISSCKHSNAWQPVYNGESELNFKHYLGRPDSSIHIEGLAKDSLGNYTEGLGYNDPLKVYTIAELENENVIRISGEVIGGLILIDSIADYHLKLKFKWGDIKWDWMKGRPKDGGILYHQGAFRHELQIHEGDIGSYWAKKVIFDVPATTTSNLPEAILKARPFLKPYVSTLTDTMWIFNEKAPLQHFEGKDEWQIVLANPYNELPHGEWNTLEVICWKNHAIHLVNGEVNMLILNSYYREGSKILPLNTGRLTLQSEGAEIFFKEIYVKKVSATPAILKKYVE